MATSRDELGLNATRWSALCNKELPSDVGHIFVFFPKQGGSDASVVCSNADKDRVKRELKAILKQLEGSLIVSPYEN
jgi:hypothetical protein